MAAPAIGARRTSRTALVMKDGELWIVVMDDDTWVEMKLRDLLELAMTVLTDLRIDKLTHWERIRK